VRWGLIWIALCACGRFDFDSLAGSDAAIDAGTDSGPPCRTETFSSAPSAFWKVWSDPGFSSAFSGGELVIGLAPNTIGYAGAYPVQKQNFTNGKISIEVPQIGGPLKVESYLTAALDTNNGYTISYGSGTVGFINTVGGVKVVNMDIPFDPVMHRWWQIEHIAARAVVEMSTSPDGVTWALQQTVDATTPTAALTIEVSAGEFMGGVPTPGTPTFDNFTYCVQ
jgi:hypothetical protein